MLAGTLNDVPLRTTAETPATCPMKPQGNSATMSTMYEVGAPSAGEDQEMVGCTPVPVWVLKAFAPFTRGVFGGPSTGVIPPAVEAGIESLEKMNAKAFGSETAPKE